MNRNSERISRHLRDVWRPLKSRDACEDSRNLAYFHDMGQIDKLNVFHSEEVEVTQEQLDELFERLEGFKSPKPSNNNSDQD